MVLIRQIAIMPDPYAYATFQKEAAISQIGTGAGANAWLGINASSVAGCGLNGTPWKNIRVTSMSENPNRDTIREEAIDTVAPSSIYGGTLTLQGNLEGSLMFKSLHDCGLLEAMMGAGSGTTGSFTPSEASGDSTTTFGAMYQMTMIPATIAVRTVDNQARNPADGSVGMVKIYRGVGISGAELTLETKNYAQFRTNWVGRRAEVYPGSALTADVTSIVGEPSIFYNAVLNFASQVINANSITINVTRPINTNLQYIGSQFLQDLTYNGITELGGTINFAENEYNTIKFMLSGSTSGSIYTLDQGSTEFDGTLANAIPSGKLVLKFRTPDGTTTAGMIVIDEAKLTESTVSVQGQNPYEKSVNWSGVINNVDKNFTMYVNTSIS